MYASDSAYYGDQPLPPYEPRAGPSNLPDDGYPEPGGFAFPTPSIPNGLSPGWRSSSHPQSYDPSGLFFNTPGVGYNGSSIHQPMPRSVSDTAVHHPEPPPVSPLHRARTSPAPQVPLKPGARPPIPPKRSHPSFHPQETHTYPAPSLPTPYNRPPSAVYPDARPLPPRQHSRTPSIVYPDGPAPPLFPQPEFTPGPSETPYPPPPFPAAGNPYTLSSPPPFPPSRPPELGAPAASPTSNEPFVTTPHSAAQEQDELSRVLALSMAEQQRQPDPEADLTAALEESLRLHSHRSPAFPTPERPAERGFTQHASPAPSTPHPSERPMTQFEQDEAFARRLAEEEERAVTDAKPDPQRTVELSADEALARRMAEQEEHGQASVETASTTVEFSTPWTPQTPTFPPIDSPPPSSSLMSRLRRKSGGESLVSARPESVVTLEPPPGVRKYSRPVSAPALSSPIEEGDEDESPFTGGMPTPSLGPSIGDPALLRGVSMSFTPPVITGDSQVVLEIPTVVELPYGKAPPLHIQAPSWRHMLRLMAQLGKSRIEPTVEAIAQERTANALKLRIVVQFLRVHPSSSEWRTILYLTLDHPVPKSVHGAWKYTHDFATLPFSYSLSARPALLREDADSKLAKWYTIPATDALPYPTMPIEFPSLAMYLQSALDESRRAADGTGLGRLAKLVDEVYPDDRPQEEKEKEKRSLFRRAFKRGPQKDKRGGNADTYELVTPFIVNEWG